MNLTENEKLNNKALLSKEMENIKRMVKLLRFESGLDQINFSKLMGCTQGTLSKIESGILEISAIQYRHLSKVFNISELEWDLGIRDSGEKIGKVTFLDPKLASRFRIPIRYSFNCANSARFCIPLINYFKEEFGEDALLDFLISKGFNRKSLLYFYDYNHLINLNFILDLAKQIKANKDFSNETLEEITSICSEPFAHGVLANEYTHKNGKALLKKLVRHMPAYDKNLIFELEEKGEVLELVVKPREHIESFKFINKSLGDFLGQYYLSFFSSFAKFGGKGPQYQVEPIERYQDGKERWVFAIS